MAVMAAELGATHIGLNFYPPSPRCLDVEQARAIADALRQCEPTPVIVGVFVNMPVDEVESLLDTVGMDLAQLNGDEPDSDLEQLGERGFRAARLKPGETTVPLMTRDAPAFLIDSRVKGEYGGTGHTADWDAAAKLARDHQLFLAGGIKPSNVAEAVTKVRPWGIDVASGVESAPGIKDPEKIKALVAEIQRVL